jgi:cold shock CspA family protein
VQGSVKIFRRADAYGFITVGDDRVPNFYFRIEDADADVQCGDLVSFWLDERSFRGVRTLIAVEVQRLRPERYRAPIERVYHKA